MLLYGWLQNAVKSKGSARALIYRDTYLSWRGLLHRVDRRAQEFVSLGVRPGDFVGLMLGNVPDFIILALSLSKLRAAPVPLDPTTSTRELEMLMSVVPLRGLITRPRGGDAPLPNSVAVSTPASPAGPRKQAPESRKRLQGTLLSCSIYPVEERAIARRKADQIAAVLITSDSAGDPKPVERTNRNLEAEADGLASALGIGGDDKALLTVPLFHSFGFDLGMVACFSKSATLCLEDEVAAHRVLKLVREQKITVLPGNQTLFAEFARAPARRPFTHKPIRFLSQGGGLTGQALDGFHQKYGIRPLSCLHTTETGTVSVDAKGQAGTTVGKLLPSVDAKITNDASGQPIPAGREGVLWIRGPAVSPLRLGRPQVSDRTAAIGVPDDEGWLRTGDLGSIDRAKRLTLAGREDDLVRVDGKRIALGEVEGCIESLPKISAAQVQLVTDPLAGPMVVARVVLKDRRKIVEPETIIDHCARNLAPYKVPRRIEICEKLAS